MSLGSKPVLLGKIIATHGIRGQLRVVPFSGEMSVIVSLRSLLLKGPESAMEPFEVAHAAAHGKKVLITLKGIDNINQVLHLVGREVYALREQLPELPPDEYYWCDLLGLRVVTVGGEALGTLAEIIATGSNDVYVIRDGTRECLIPALEDVVVNIDLDAGVMTVSPPEGLLDL
jgi:16S rRNA processing protein RimM